MKDSQVLPISLVNPLYKVGAAITFLAILVLGTVYLSFDYKDAKFAEIQLEIATEQAKQLKIATDKVRANEQTITNLQTQLEGSYDKENARVNEVLGHYTSLINDGFRLRDNRGIICRSVPSNGSTATSDSSNQSASSGELSAEATGFLLNFAADADKVVNQFKICKKYAIGLRDTCSSNK